ncbi:ribosomal 60S subunit protein L13A [Saccharomycopsis crataegensis]|uniref:60S ribosomal protein L13 n=1 Tax=Saccharomycopsis crataegensis TaxID=43959 RepID=A0AAV5QFH7_9ASCO|nr:ribosomal 60S subunit protein L13A [Saccharomycopsis crataegensis]
MAISKNLPLLKNHFRKHWQERVKVHFDQAGKKTSRRLARAKKAAASAPTPIDLLRPIVRAPTIRYNRKVRAGRGFTLAEIKAVGLTPAKARSVGIAVDHRRQNRSEEGFQLNVNRLKEYQSKLIVFPTKGKKPSAEQVSAAAVFPIVAASTEVETKAISEEAKSFEAYKTLRLARSDKKYAGIREKRAREKAEAEADKKKK